MVLTGIITHCVGVQKMGFIRVSAGLLDFISRSAGLGRNLYWACSGISKCTELGDECAEKDVMVRRNSKSRGNLCHALEPLSYTQIKQEFLSHEFAK